MEFLIPLQKKIAAFRLAKKHRLLLGLGFLLLLSLVLILALPPSPYTRRYEALSAEEIETVRTNTPGESPEREAVAEAALSLVGKVHYFWGGKSSAVGPDPAWGELRQVDSAGSSSTGSLKPYGLDCSGFVSWCFIQLGLSPARMEEQVGSGTWNQWDRTESIPWKSLRVGDFVFQNRYPTDKGNHIGICIGFDEEGEPLFAHCAAAFDNVVVTHAGDVFKHARRPMFYND